MSKRLTRVCVMTSDLTNLLSCEDGSRMTAKCVDGACFFLFPSPNWQLKFPAILCGELYCDPESAIYRANIGQKVLKNFWNIPIQNPMLKRQYVLFLKKLFHQRLADRRRRSGTAPLFLTFLFPRNWVLCCHGRQPHGFYCRCVFCRCKRCTIRLITSCSMGACLTGRLRCSALRMTTSSLCRYTTSAELFSGWTAAGRSKLRPAFEILV